MTNEHIARAIRLEAEKNKLCSLTRKQAAEIKTLRNKACSDADAIKRLEQGRISRIITIEQQEKEIERLQQELLDYGKKWAEHVQSFVNEQERLRKALSDLVEDLEDRAKWMKFRPDKDGLTVPCGSGVYTRAKYALDLTSKAEQST